MPPPPPSEKCGPLVHGHPFQRQRCLPSNMLPGALRVFAVRAQRLKFLFDLHLVRGARVLGQEPHHPLLGHQGVGGLERSGGSGRGGLEFQRGHPPVLQRLGQDLLDGLIIRPVWDLAAFPNRGFKSPVGTKIGNLKRWSPK